MSLSGVRMMLASEWVRKYSPCFYFLEETVDNQYNFFINILLQNSSVNSVGLVLLIGKIINNLLSLIDIDLSRLPILPFIFLQIDSQVLKDFNLPLSFPFFSNPKYTYHMKEIKFQTRNTYYSSTKQPHYLCNFPLKIQYIPSIQIVISHFSIQKKAKKYDNMIAP